MSDLACIEDVSQPRSEAPATSCTVLDGAVIAQMLKPTTAKTFNKYVLEVFTPYILSKFQQTTRLDLVWDCYLPDSLNGMTRAKRGTGIRRRVFCIHPSVVHPSPATGPASAESITTRRSCSVSYLASYSTPYNLQTSSWKGCTKKCKCKKANLECTQPVSYTHLTLPTILRV